MAKIIYEGDEIVNTTKRSKTNHATKIYMDKCKWACCTTFNNLDDMLMWLLPLHIAWTNGTTFQEKRYTTSELLFAQESNTMVIGLAKEENSTTQIGNYGSSMMYKYRLVPNSQTPWTTTWLSLAKTKHISL
jgi:hypothetical protein